VRSAIHCRASEFNKTQSHERSLMAIRANRDFGKEPGGREFLGGVFLGREFLLKVGVKHYDDRISCSTVF
jgi:hypothetical protein